MEIRIEHKLEVQRAWLKETLDILQRVAVMSMDLHTPLGKSFGLGEIIREFRAKNKFYEVV